MNYLESKVKYNKVTEQGRVKRATETYLVDAMSYTEAEAKTLQELEGVDDIFIDSIKKSNIEEVLKQPQPIDDAKWYKAKIAVIDANPLGVEKKTFRYLLIEGSNVDEALETLQKELGKYVIPVEIVSIGDSNIFGIIEHE